MFSRNHSWAVFVVSATCFCGSLNIAYSEPVGQPPAESTIQTGQKNPGDPAIVRRVQAIFDEIQDFDNLKVEVQSGVVTLRGTVTDAGTAKRAESLVSRVEGVATIENRIERDVSLESRLDPALEQTRSLLQDTIALLPLFALALVVFTGVLMMGILIAGRTNFWRRITPNLFVADLATTLVRVVFFIIALVLALNLLGATALLGAVLGSAGVIGLALGFAVRDTIENYIASILLSLRQPFRPNDHVIINDREGRVIRLTSRATVLMTLDGNQLRIPNAEVFKGTILNFSANPERRFDFQLGVDADDDPLAAIQTGVETLQPLEFVLQEPAPFGLIREVGDSNILIQYFAWINQQDTDFGKSRSIALAAVKNALEGAGFGLPEPIYRLRFDKSALGSVSISTGKDTGPVESSSAPVRTPQVSADQALDVRPDTKFEEKVDQERRATGEQDLLDGSAPAE